MILRLFKAHVGKHGDQISPWVHLNLTDISPPGHPILDVLRNPKGRTNRIRAWANALRQWPTGLPPILKSRADAGVKIDGCSIEGEQLVPVPHDGSPIGPGDIYTTRCIAVRDALQHLSRIINVSRIVPYGAAQILEAHTIPTTEEHVEQSETWRSVYSRGFLNPSPSQTFSVRMTDFRFSRLRHWIGCALDRHQATGDITVARPLTVFIKPELDSPDAGLLDDFREVPSYLSTHIIDAVHRHPCPCHLVSWFKASTPARATKAETIYQQMMENLAARTSA